MKKLYLVGLVLLTASIAGCTFNTPKTPVVTTGTVQEMT